MRLAFWHCLHSGRKRGGSSLWRPTGKLSTSVHGFGLSSARIVDVSHAQLWDGKILLPGAHGIGLEVEIEKRRPSRERGRGLTLEDKYICSIQPISSRISVSENHRNNLGPQLLRFHLSPSSHTARFNSVLCNMDSIIFYKGPKESDATFSRNSHKSHRPAMHAVSHVYSTPAKIASSHLRNWDSVETLDLTLKPDSSLGVQLHNIPDIGGELAHLSAATCQHKTQDLPRHIPSLSETSFPTLTISRIF